MNPIRASREEFYRRCKANVILRGHRIGLWWEAERLANLREGHVFYIKYQKERPDPQVDDEIVLAEEGVRLRILDIVSRNSSSETSFFHRKCQGILWCQVEPV